MWGSGLELQDVEIKHDYSLFNLGGAEVVLGMDWLASMGA